MMLVCGYNVKESLKRSHFYLDINATITGSDYIPPPLPTTDESPKSSEDMTNEPTPTVKESGIVIASDAGRKRVKITNRKYFTDECTKLLDIPAGKHVLTISTDPKHPEHVSSLTHIITFE